MICKQIGLRIKELRLSKNLSQENASLDAGIDRTYWSSVENGKRNISIVNLYKICKVLNTPLDNFFNSELFKDL
ncbi:MAG: helix-turn-helix domain-containing protein [Alphaproteobacteria bacterium]